MKIKEFQEKYHEYSTDNEQEARIEALKLRVVDKNGKVEPVHAIKLGDKWCLMLNSAAKLLEETGII